jgi:hypothetical protein
MNKVIFISDFFIDEINGGAERCNSALIEMLNKDFSIIEMKSLDVNLNFVAKNKNNFFIIANFFTLNEEVKNYLIDNVRYIIYEHDHKYIKNNNPLMFKNFFAPESQIQNKKFFKNAEYVICQSKMHADILYKNLLITNIVNAGANFWSKSDLMHIEKCMEMQKSIKFASMSTNNKNKGTRNSIEYAKKESIDLQLIPALGFKDFITTLGKVENFIFFPQWVESYSRVAIEARILGCKIVTNKLLGVASEPYFSLQGHDLLKKIKANNTALIKKIRKVIKREEIDKNYNFVKIPKITISCSVYDGDKYIRHFLEDITKQTIFEDCELIIVNANSPGNEEDVINEYSKKYDNIFYKKLDYRATTTEVINMVIEDLATGEFITVGNIDDRRSHDCLEIQAKHLMFNEDISLVYGDCLETKVGNETFENNSSLNAKYEHSIKRFSKNNMIKCLPGPMPMWRLSAHKEVGTFSKNYDFANDWDMWLRMVDKGMRFKKIDKSIGLYYFNPDGRSTSQDNFLLKIKEEAELFFKYKHIFGQYNFNKFKAYFSKGVENE